MSEQSSSLINGNISDIMQSAYIDYSMSVIVSRALPDVRDGFKPVQRRVLYAMLREGLLHNRAYDKCAGVVGEVLKNYHPHGDGSVYDHAGEDGSNMGNEVSPRGRPRQLWFCGWRFSGSLSLHRM